VKRGLLGTERGSDTVILSKVFYCRNTVQRHILKIDECTAASRSIFWNVANDENHYNAAIRQSWVTIAVNGYCLELV
jgi:hypothetical protein